MRVGYSGKVRIKLYRLDSKWQWYFVTSWYIPNDAGYLKIDALPVDFERFPKGEPYRVEQWIDDKLVQLTGNYQTGEPEFLLGGGSTLPWGCLP
jgi:hypothetical protein